MVQARHVGKIFLNSWWHAYFNVFFWIYCYLNSIHCAIKSAKISIWRCWENTFEKKFSTEYKSTAQTCRRNTTVNPEGWISFRFWKYNGFAELFSQEKQGYAFVSEWGKCYALSKLLKELPEIRYDDRIYCHAICVWSGWNDRTNIQWKSTRSLGEKPSQIQYNGKRTCLI